MTNTPQPPAGDAELRERLRSLFVNYVIFRMDEHDTHHNELDEYLNDAMELILAREKAQREALAIEERIKENQLYLTEKNRHYYPASPIDPYIPLVQFAERISELQLKLKHLKDPERS